MILVVITFAVAFVVLAIRSVRGDFAHRGARNRNQARRK